MDQIKSILNQVFENLTTGQAKKPGQIQAAWDSAVTNDEAKHTKIVEFEKGYLIVHVDSSVRMFQLTMKKRHLTEKLQSEIPELKSIVLKIGKIR